MSTELLSPGGEAYVYPLVALFGANTILYILVQTCGKRDNSWIDVQWSLCFAIPNIVLILMRLAASKDDPELSITPRMLLITIPMLIWSLRLSLYIFIRHKSEDYRYKQMRERWESKGTTCYYISAYCYVYLMQGVFSLINNSSVLYVNLYAVGGSPDESISSLTYLDWIGLVIWAIGFSIEVISDSQLASHLKNPAPGTGKFIKSGLWRYSRHPNYFGEALSWWGIWLIACGEEMGWVTVYSCLFITLLIRFVSGVPFPEKKYAKNQEWQQYCKETNVFVPWFYKSVNSNIEQ
mmetsp:Transcript_17522/g.29545  ORF Transcript_17522/g.29545 Transcript_17522/m.29545 type:complete len:294 (-) Transcript_17522:75-956(-)